MKMKNENEKKLTFREFLDKERNREEILGGSSRLTNILNAAINTSDIALSTSTLREFDQRVKKLQLISEDSSFTNLEKAIKQIDFGTSSALASATKALDMSAFTSTAKSLDISAFPSATRALDMSAFTSAAKALDMSALTSAAKSLDMSAFTSAAKSLDISAFPSATRALDMSAFTSAAKALDTSAFRSVAQSYGSFLNSISPISKIYSSELAKIKSNIDTFGLKNIINSEVFIEAKNIQNELVKLDPNIDILPITTLENSLKSGDPKAFEITDQEVQYIALAEQVQASTSDIPLRDENPINGNAIDVLIITGLPLELNIFIDVFEVRSRWYSKTFQAQYYFGSVESDTKVYSVALACGLNMGNIHASQITNAAIEDLNPKIVISAGIGYTLNPKKLQLCDLHITNMIVHWGLTSKEYEGAGRKVRSAPVQVKSNHLFQEIRDYEVGLKKGKTPFIQWQDESKCVQPEIAQAKVDIVLKDINKAIKCGVPTKIFNERPKVEVGNTMVSDDAVIASLKEIKRRSLFEAGNECQISGEMEAAGVAMASAMRRAPIEFIAVRGMSDFGFGKEALEDSSKAFRRIAATRAATFIKSFLESDPTLPVSNGVAVKLGNKKK